MRGPLHRHRVERESSPPDVPVGLLLHRSIAALPPSRRQRPTAGGLTSYWLLSGSCDLSLALRNPPPTALPAPQDGPYQSSLQAIRQHEFVGLLEQPGSADLSSRVDYSALRWVSGCLHLSSRRC